MENKEIIESESDKDNIYIKRLGYYKQYYNRKKKKIKNTQIKIKKVVVSFD
jgi:hypothetical protein